MALSNKDVVALVGDQLIGAFDTERRRLNEIDLWYRHNQPDIFLPRRHTQEMARLAELAKTPWLGLVVAVLSQAAFIDGFKAPESSANVDASWRTWLGNHLDSRQIAINRATFAFGYSFATVLPGRAPDGSNMARIRGWSPRDMQGFYAEDDLAEADFPMYLLRVSEQPNGERLIWLYDEANRYTLTSEGGLKLITVDAHKAGVCPGVRFANQLDLEGRADGEVEPFIPVAGRLNKTDFDRLLAQHFQSMQVRYITGMALPENDEDAAAEANRKKMQLRHDDILIAEDPEARIGVLPPTPLDGLISARKADVETLAAVSQTPTNALTGDMVNLSAEALQSIRAQFDQKLGERKISLGRSYAQALRLAARLEGNLDVANDVSARVTWQDTSTRSLAQAVDAYGKAVTMLNVPAEALWSKIPGVTQDDVREWQTLARRDAARAQISALSAAAQAARANPLVTQLGAQGGNGSGSGPAQNAA